MTAPRVLSICHGAGLLDRAFLDVGFDVEPGCEIDEQMQQMYDALCPTRHPRMNGALEHLVINMERDWPGTGWDGVIGGPPCQSHSRLRAVRNPKFKDESPDVRRLLAAISPSWFLFENVVPLDLPDAKHVYLDAMHFYKPHQSRPRWFTYSSNLTPPEPLYSGTVDDLVAYSIVAGRIYGPKRGAVLQGYPEFAKMNFPCAWLQLGLANAVPYPLALAWARSISTTAGWGYIF